MKELSIEQKAKAYDEAVIRGSRLWESDTITRENYEYIFPELAEDKEEKIKDAAIEFVRQNKAFNYSLGISKEEVIAWLEKQGEQKLVECNEEWYSFVRWFVKERTDDYTLIPSDTDIRTWGDIILKHAKKELLERANEQKPAAWSEEDEKIYNRIYDIVHAAAFANYDVDEDGNECGEYAKIIGWFKSLKDRVQPQPIQEWSEEDETGLTNAIIMLKEGASLHFNKKNITKAVDWLRSLKGRV